MRSWIRNDSGDSDNYLFETAHKVVTDWWPWKVCCAGTASNIEKVIRPQHGVIFLRVARCGKNPIHWYCHLDNKAQGKDTLYSDLDTVILGYACFVFCLFYFFHFAFLLFFFLFGFYFWTYGGTHFHVCFRFILGFYSTSPKRAKLVRAFTDYWTSVSIVPTATQKLFSRHKNGVSKMLPRLVLLVYILVKLSRLLLTNHNVHLVNIKGTSYFQQRHYLHYWAAVVPHASAYVHAEGEGRQNNNPWKRHTPMCTCRRDSTVQKGKKTGRTKGKKKKQNCFVMT